MQQITGFQLIPRIAKLGTMVTVSWEFADLT